MFALLEECVSSPLLPGTDPPTCHMRFVADGSRALWGDASVTSGANQCSSLLPFLPGILIITEFQQLDLSGKASAADLHDNERST